MLQFLPILLAHLSPQVDPLAEAFMRPPLSARPHTWWHWMNGNVTKEGITADLKAMSEVGIGGAQMFTVDQGIPHGPVDYNSELWREMTAFAVKEAAKFGIELCIHNCAGWSSSGGPWIDPEHAMQVVGWSEIQVKGPTHFQQQLPQIKAPQVYANVDFHKDIIAYAFPTPPAKHTWENFLGKTGVIRQDGLQPNATDANSHAAIHKSKLIPLTLDQNGKLDWNVPPGDWTILRIGHTPTGKDNHPAPPEGDGLEVDKLSREAMDVHWRGMMAKVIEECGPLAGKVLNNALIDSYEVGSQNWTPKMRDEFQKRRGYDMAPWLPVMAGYVIESAPMSERFLWDLRKTISELFVDNYFKYFGELCHRAGMQFSTEPYGNGGFDAITAGGTADIPMGEFWIGGGAMDTTRIAASVGHVYGRPIVGAESFTADDVRGKFLEEPYAVKAIGDQVFCNGINRYIFHRYAMQPWMDLKPGMTMGPWGTHLERTQTWWKEAQSWMTYIARCQFLLQQGRFVADVLYYVGENSPEDWVYGPAHNPRPPSGFDYDSCDAASLLKLQFKNGVLLLPSGMQYRILVLPDSQTMTPAIAKKLQQLVNDGATIVGPRPLSSPSLTNYPAADDTVKQYANALWKNINGNSVTENRYGSGRVVFGKTVQELLSSLKVAPNFEYRRRVGSAKLVYIHKQIGNLQYYFVSNQNYQPTQVDAIFRVSGRQPELWHADTGRVENAPVFREESGRTVVPLTLAPAESVFVVFRSRVVGQHLTHFDDASTAATAPAPKIDIIRARYETADGRGADVTQIVQSMVKNGENEIPATNAVFGDPVVNVVKQLTIEYTVDGKATKKTVPENEMIVLFETPSANIDTSLVVSSDASGVMMTAFKWGAYRAKTSRNKAVQIVMPAVPKSLDLSANWTLNFDTAMGAPASIAYPSLTSWTDHANNNIKYYSGSATYKKSFTISAETAKALLMLDLGRVKNFATITLNGKTLEPLWKEPFTAIVTGLAKPGENKLEIKITNLWVNRLIGDEQLPADAEWNGASLNQWPDWINDRSKRPNTGRKAFTTWRFWNKDSKLLESGLLGPVHLRIGVRKRIL